ncbi:MAG: hypothetical protein ACI841_005291 [Planctomycetota bacterium]
MFNNSNARPTGNGSSLKEWAPPVDGSGNNSLAPGAAYGATALTWTYSDQGNFYTSIMGGAERLRNGNTLGVETTSDRPFEVDAAGTIIWEHLHSGLGSPFMFKARRYDDCDANLIFDGEEIANGSGSDMNGNGVRDNCEAPTNYCTATMNSTGQAASMGWSGSTSITANDFGLDVTQCPTSQNGLFYYGPGQTQTPFGDGLPCFSAASIGTSRLNPVQLTDGSGNASRAIDFTQPPTVVGAGQISAGSTWTLQFWYRDPAGGPANLNRSDGPSVTFTQ